MNEVKFDWAVFAGSLLLHVLAGALALLLTPVGVII